MKIEAVLAAARSLRGPRRSRVVSGSAANLLTLCFLIIVQLTSVPVLMHAFGIERYGVWLLLSTVPTYLILSDIGLINAAQNDMAMKVTSGGTDNVLIVFQSVSTAVASVFGLLAAITAAAVFLLNRIPGFWPGVIAPHTWAVPLLAAYAALYMIALVPVAALRATGYYARATMMHDGATFLESISMMVAAWLTGSLVAAACAPVIVRGLALPLIYWQMRRLRPYLHWGVASARLAEVKRLLPAALGSIAIPIGLALNLQGSVIVVGAFLGPIAVATFVTVRTASRLAVQMVGVVNRAIIPEVSAARGRSDALSERRYWQLSNMVIWLVLAPAAAAFALLGSEVVSIWTGGRIHPPALFVALMASTILLHGLWFYRVMLISATNEHVALAKYVIGFPVAGLVLEVGLVQLWGLTGVALSIVIVDLILTVTVGRFAQRITIDPDRLAPAEIDLHFPYE
jgi:O-antigen/teichoic acid export membrane protein